jgi:hypothetical protein
MTSAQRRGRRARTGAARTPGVPGRDPLAPAPPVVAILPAVRRLDWELLSVRERALGPGRPPADVG